MSRIDPSPVVNITDLRAIAKKRLQRVVFDSGRSAGGSRLDRQRLAGTFRRTRAAEPAAVQPSGRRRYVRRGSAPEIPASQEAGAAEVIRR